MGLVFFLILAIMRAVSCPERRIGQAILQFIAIILTFRMTEGQKTLATVEERIKAVTAQILKIAPDQVRSECSFTVDLGASSVQSVELVAAFEEEFDIEMEEDAALSVETVGKAVEYIAGVCKEQGVEVEL